MGIPMNAPAPANAMLAAFGAAWSAHDIEALMSFMTDDCEFLTAAGPDACGTRHAGRDTVRCAFESVWQAMPDAHWRHASCVVQGHRWCSHRGGRRRCLHTA
jgi:ketosteroid isomerase-like protein